MRERLENFWYHHKWKTLIIAFFVAVAIIGIVQIAVRDEYDAQIVYAGPAVMVADSSSGDRIAAAFSSLDVGDRDGDGEARILVNAKTVLSDEQLAEKQKEAAEDHDHVAYDPSLRTESMSQIRTLMLTDQVQICLFDPYVYGTFPPEEHFVALSELFGETPKGAVDEYAVRLKDTDFGKQTSFSSLPDDTLICLHRQVSGKKGAGESFEYSKKLFVAALTYSSGSSSS